ncbi:MAG: hypothetical protein KJZ93_12915 [Caldilineaceae bacterium]|nr:hypothetical protein [Caldilineaceae bacterium]
MSDLHAPATATPSSLIQQAIAALNQASAVTLADGRALVEERNVWQPGSWLIQRCWEALADIGVGEAALNVARLAETRHPLAPVQALHRVAHHVHTHPLLLPLLGAELARLEQGLFAPHHSSRLSLGGPATSNPTPGAIEPPAERLLLVAATAALVENLPLACACLERLDQTPGAWARIVARSESRTWLAEAVAHMGVHPLTLALVTGAIRRFDDAGAQFLFETAAIVAGRGDAAPRRSRRLLLRCVETFQYATLTTLLSRRLAATTLGRAGKVDEVLTQLNYIANVQDARREAGLSAQRDDAQLLRQVKRPAANTDVDFQVYTLQQVAAAAPLRDLPREKRIALADQLAFLGVRSDGWTAAGAATTLIELGALKYAVEVVEHIAANDPTRAEGMLSLVRGLLAVNEPMMAAEQAQRALAWARAKPDRNPARAVIWGLAEIYLEQGEPEQALRWLAEWREPTGWRQRIATLWRKPLDDDALRLQSLRLRGLLQLAGEHAAPDTTRTREVQQGVERLRTWAPQLLEGEALVNFLLDGLLQPLLAAGWSTLVKSLLPDLVQALAATSGNKHTMQVTTVASLLAHQLRLAGHVSPRQTAETNGSSDHDWAITATAFLADLWQHDAQRGPWQLVHSLEGSIPLLLALEGPDALVALARAATRHSSLWRH